MASRRGTARAGSARPSSHARAAARPTTARTRTTITAGAAASPQAHAPPRRSRQTARAATAAVKALRPRAIGGERTTSRTRRGGANRKARRRRVRSREGTSVRAPLTSTQSMASPNASPPATRVRKVRPTGPRTSPRSIARTRQPRGGCVHRSISRPCDSTATSAGRAAKRARRTRARRWPELTRTGSSSREPSSAQRNMVSPLPVSPSLSHRSRKPRAKGASPAPTLTNRGAGRSSPAASAPSPSAQATARRSVRRTGQGGTRPSTIAHGFPW